MATLLQNYSEYNFIWIDEIPEVGVKTLCDTVKFSLTISNEKVHEDTLYACGGKVIVDILSITRENMLLRNLCLGTITLTFADEDSTEYVYINATQRKCKTIAGVEAWTESRFMSAVQSKMLPSDAADYLTAILPADKDSSTAILAHTNYMYIDVNGNYQTGDTTTHVDVTARYRREVRFSMKWPTQCTTLGHTPVMMTVSLNGRRMTYYNPNRQCAAFQFINMFGALETLYDNVTVAEQRKVSTSMAMIRAKRMPYDIKTTQELNITFGPKKTGDFAFIEQLASSPYIYFWEESKGASAIRIAPTGGHRLVVESADFTLNPDGDGSLIPTLKCVDCTGLPILIDTPTDTPERIFTEAFTQQFT